MTRLSAFARDTRAATAAEFALILPIAILFLLGLIDVGRYAWAFNQAEKATQVGARWAAATEYVPGILNSYSFATNGVTSGGTTSGIVAQGDVVPKASFPGIRCEIATTGSGNNQSQSLACTCLGSSNASGFCSDTQPNTAAFQALVGRMNEIHGRIGLNDVRIDYDWSGLGYSGDPNGSDVAPIITVSLKQPQRFPMWFLLGRTVPFPDAHYTITGEDGQGTCANTGGC